MVDALVHSEVVGFVPPWLWHLLSPCLLHLAFLLWLRYLSPMKFWNLFSLWWLHLFSPCLLHLLLRVVEALVPCGAVGVAPVVVVAFVLATFVSLVLSFLLSFWCWKSY